MIKPALRAPEAAELARYEQCSGDEGEPEFKGHESKPMNSITRWEKLDNRPFQLAIAPIGSLTETGNQGHPEFIIRAKRKKEEAFDFGHCFWLDLDTGVEVRDSVCWPKTTTKCSCIFK